jgi:glycerophosphoryl diester phosphodiesterase
MTFRDSEVMTRRLTLALLTVMIVTAALIRGAQLANSATSSDTCPVADVVAHRGGYADVDRTENTVGAYVAAHAYGLDFWETDIRFDRHSVPYLMHDSPIDRTTNGTGWASSVDIATTTVRMNDGTALKDQTLDRFMSYAARYGATVALEPKVAPTQTQVKQLLAVLDRYAMRNRTIFDSFHPENLAPIKNVAPDVLAYALVDDVPLVTPAAAKAIGSIVMVRDSALTAGLVAGYHAAGLAVYAWTIDSPSAWSAHRDLGIDRVVTNRPARYMAWRAHTCG